MYKYISYSSSDVAYYHLFHKLKNLKHQNTIFFFVFKQFKFNNDMFGIIIMLACDFFYCKINKNVIEIHKVQNKFVKRLLYNMYSQSYAVG